MASADSTGMSSDWDNTEVLDDSALFFKEDAEVDDDDTDEDFTLE